MSNSKNLPRSADSAVTLPADVQKVLQSLPKEAQVQVLTLLAASYSYSGPLPPSSEVEAYNRSIPDGGNRLMCVVENQAKARAELDRVVITTKSTLDKRGQAIGCVIGLVGIAAGTFLVYMGHDWAGTAFFTSTLISLVCVFVTGKIPKVPKS